MRAPAISTFFARSFFTRSFVTRSFVARSFVMPSLLTRSLVGRASLLFVAGIALAAVSCNNTPGQSKASAGTTLTRQTIYDIDSVRAAAAGGDEKAALKQFASAIDAYKNAKDPNKSLPLFMAAILQHPTAKAYFEMGSALLDAGKPEEAIRALQIAEGLEYSPLANVMYKLAGAYSLRLEENELSSETDSAAKYYMQVAIQMGFARPGLFVSEEVFKGMRARWGFSKEYNAALSGNAHSGGSEGVLWQTFQAGFTKMELPLTINTVWIHDHRPAMNIAFDYEKFVPEMRNAKFSREVENEYYFVAQLQKTQTYTALMYAGVNNFLTDANQGNPAFYILATYDNNGKIIDKMDVAGQRNFKAPFKVGVFQPNFTFEVKDFNNIYKNDPETAGYDSNYVVRSEPLGTANYKITPQGKFEKTDAPLAMR